MVKKVLVGYGIDVDAVSGWINTTNGTPADVTNISRGIFGATVGTDRLLKMFDHYKVKATWFIPAHSIESFPKQMVKVRDAGHEMYVGMTNPIGRSTLTGSVVCTDTRTNSYHSSPYSKSKTFCRSLSTCSRSLSARSLAAGPLRLGHHRSIP